MMSLAARIGLSAGLVLAIFIVLTAAALEHAFRDSAESALRERLLGQVYVLIAAAEVDPHGELNMAGPLRDVRLSRPGSGLYAAVDAAGGRSAWRSPSLLGSQIMFPGVLAPGAQRFERKTTPDGSGYYVLSLGVSWNVGNDHYPFVFSVAEDAAGYTAQIHSYRNTLWSWLGAMALLLLLVQTLALRWGLRPLRRVAAELSAIEAGTQDALEQRYPRELLALTDNLNTLLRHERAQQARYREALANLAHSLKTPLAVLRGALGAREEPAVLQHAVSEQVERMDKIVAYQLQHATTSGRSVLRAALAVAPVLQRLVDSLAKVYRDKAVRVSRDVQSGAEFRGDEGDLMELLGNVLDNAFKWCRSEVSVAARTVDGRLQLRVEDDGPGIAHEQVEHILQRGVRLDESTPGHGIGLAIVRDIIQAYGGRLSLTPRSGGGTCVQIDLPGR